MSDLTPLNRGERWLAAQAGMIPTPEPLGRGEQWMAAVVEHIENDKADLVDGKVPVEQLPEMPSPTIQLKTINGESLEGEGNIATPTYHNFNESWVTTGITTAAFAAQVDADELATIGQVYLGDAHFTDMPFNGNGEVTVSVIGGMVSAKVILLTLTSATDAPYHWEYTYYNGVGYGWKSWASANQVTVLYRHHMSVILDTDTEADLEVISPIRYAFIDPGTSYVDAMSAHLYFNGTPGKDMMVLISHNEDGTFLSVVDPAAPNAIKTYTFTSIEGNDVVTILD